MAKRSALNNNRGLRLAMPRDYSFDEKKKGSIEPGKLADFAVISKDYLSCPEDKIKDIDAFRTVVGGRIVYENLI